MDNKVLNYTALTIAIIGAVNWGLIGFFNFNLVSWLFGSNSWLSKVIYGLVGHYHLLQSVKPSQTFPAVRERKLRGYLSV